MTSSNNPRHLFKFELVWLLREGFTELVKDIWLLREKGFYSLLHQIKLKSKIIVGVSVLLWAIWLSRNDVILDKTLIKTYMQVMLYREHTVQSLSTTTKSARKTPR
jgi:hypothetical protein